MRFEYCESSKGSLLYIRAIQGHTGGIMIAPELSGHVDIVWNWKETGGRSSSDTKTKLHVQRGTENKSSQCRLHTRPWRTNRSSASTGSLMCP